MQVGQVIITSSGSGKSTNRLTARTENIDDALTQQLCVLCPSRNSLEYGQRESIGYAAVGEGQFGFYRSVAGPIDSQMQRQILSYVVVLSRYQFQRFDYHAPDVVHCLRTGGHLGLKSDPEPLLPMVELPDRFMTGMLGIRTSKLDTEKVQNGLSIHNQIGLLGVQRPLDLIGALFNETPIEQRADISFAIGRRANDNASFRMYVLHQHDNDLSREFAQAQIRPWSLGGVPAKA